MLNRNNQIHVAGNITHRILGPQVQEAKTFLVLRERVQAAARIAATPPRRSRRTKKAALEGAGRWPSQITFESLKL